MQKISHLSRLRVYLIFIAVSKIICTKETKSSQQSCHRNYSVVNLFGMYVNIHRHFVLFVFRRGFCVLELENVVGGVYNIMPCTFHPGKEGPFFLTVSASTQISLVKLQ